MASDAVQLSVFNSLLASIAEEMGAVLIRSSLSPNIRERRDLSCAVFDAEGSLVAQAAHIPVHLGAMPASVEAVQSLAQFAPGDLMVLNDPYLGGSHLPDVTMVSPVFTDTRPRRLIGYVASRAHQADIGGMTPGSMPLAGELIQEGLIIPPVRLYRAGVLNEDVLALVLRNVRTPDERRGDFEAQVSAQRTGERRLAELANRYGAGVLRRRMSELLDYAERLTRARLKNVPEGAYSFEDCLDGDGINEGAIPIKVKVTIRGEDLEADFEGTATERAGSINAVPAVARSAVYYAVFCLMGEEAPINAGGFRPITVKLPPGSILSPQSYRAVSAGNVETSQRIVDTVFGALAKALPDRIPAASNGSMNNVLIGGYDSARGRRFTYYETLAGGAGAGPEGPGLSAVHTHMTNTLNTPVEAIEATFPFRIAEYSMRAGSGGAARHPGGDGLRRAYEFLEPAEVTLMTERRENPPWGLAGGGPGAPGRNELVRTTGERVALPAKASFSVQAGDRVVVETPGGGGWGMPERAAAPGVDACL
jgi:N-methylhydantoinase B